MTHPELSREDLAFYAYLAGAMEVKSIMWPKQIRYYVMYKSSLTDSKYLDGKYRFKISALLNKFILKFIGFKKVWIEKRKVG